MGDLSIYNNIRSSKVTTGNAVLFQSTRTFDDDAKVCPARSNVSDYGVIGVPRDSINTLTAGCYSALNRITVENLLRPSYSEYLNASAISIPGVGSDSATANFAYQSSPYYDTQLGNQYIRPVEQSNQIHPEYKLSQFKAVGPVNPQLAEANKVSSFMNSTYENRYFDTYA